MKSPGLTIKPKIVIIKTGRTFPSIISGLGDFEDWIARANVFRACLRSSHNQDRSV